MLHYKVEHRALGWTGHRTVNPSIQIDFNCGEALINPDRVKRLLAAWNGEVNVPKIIAAPGINGGMSLADGGLVMSWELQFPICERPHRDPYGSFLSDCATRANKYDQYRCDHLCVSHGPNENKMNDGGRDRASLGVKVWKSS